MSTQQLTPSPTTVTLPTAADVHRWREQVVLMGEPSTMQPSADLHPDTFENYSLQLNAHRAFVAVHGLTAETEMIPQRVAAWRDLVLHANELHCTWVELSEAGQQHAEAKMCLAIQHFPIGS